MFGFLEEVVVVGAAVAVAVAASVGHSSRHFGCRIRAVVCMLMMVC